MPLRRGLPASALETAGGAAPAAGVRVKPWPSQPLSEPWRKSTFGRGAAGACCRLQQTRVRAVKVKRLLLLRASGGGATTILAQVWGTIRRRSNRVGEGRFSNAVPRRANHRV